MFSRSRKYSTNNFSYESLESRNLLATLAEAGISQRVIDYVDQLAWTSDVLNDEAMQNTLDAIIASESAPANATVINTASQFSQIQSGGTYLVQGDITLTSTFHVPSNVTIYVDGSIYMEGNFTAPGGVHSAENYDDAIFEITNGVSNINLIGIDNALLHSNPSLDPAQPHASAVIVESSASNITVQGFEIANVWNALVGFWGTENVLFKNNYIHDTLDRAIWMLGTTETAVVHNFIENPGIDGIDFDAFTDFSVAYENVVVGAGRWAGFVEEGAHDNYFVRGLAVMADFGNPNTTFQMGWADNGTSPNFVNNNPGILTENNYFIDNVVFRPSSFHEGGNYFAKENAGKGWTYFWGNRGYGVGTPTLLHIAEWLEYVPTSGGPDGSVNGVQVLEDLDALYNEIMEPEGQAYREENGLVSIEAEHFSSSQAGLGSADGKEWVIISDSNASGELAVAALTDSGVNTQDNLDGPRLDFEIDFQTPGNYRVFLRTLGINSGSNSAHVGLDGVLLSNGGQGMGDGSNQWVWVDDVTNGPANVTITINSAGRHTLNIWMREDGVQLDKIVLDQAAEQPSGLGPNESPFGQPPLAIDDFVETLEDEPIVVNVLENDSDPTEDPLFISSITQAAHGTVVLNEDNTVTYVPDENYFGNDSFNYTINDGNRNEISASVNVTVTPVNDSPSDIEISNQIVSEYAQTQGANFLVGQLVANDIDSSQFTFGLTSGSGDNDNALFEVVGNELRIKQGVVIDFETKPTFDVRVFADDGENTTEKQLEIVVQNEVELKQVIIGDGTAQRSRIETVQIEFDQPVTVATGAVLLMHRGTGDFVETSLTLDATSTIATLTFSGDYVFRNGSALINGNYELIIDGGGVQSLDSGRAWDADGTGIFGGTYHFGDEEVDQFFALFGDLNGDRVVNLVDHGQMRRAITHTSEDPEYIWALDLNGDGWINLFDGAAFRRNIWVNLPFE